MSPVLGSGPTPEDAGTHSALAGLCARGAEVLPGLLTASRWCPSKALRGAEVSPLGEQEKKTFSLVRSRRGKRSPRVTRPPAEAAVSRPGG